MAQALDSLHQGWSEIVFNSHALNGGCDSSTAQMFLQLAVIAAFIMVEPHTINLPTALVLADEPAFVTIGSTKKV
ncbi:MAG TPA: hypothetical protein EYN72_02290 [Dehalococcoidia bacterium]|nr:hypothetical protein [Dehalococcoidia bacterium]